MTDVFEAFHREPRHRQKLEAFRVGTLVGYTPSPLVEDFRALKEELEEEGLFEVSKAGTGKLEVFHISCGYFTDRRPGVWVARPRVLLLDERGCGQRYFAGVETMLVVDVPPPFFCSPRCRQHYLSNTPKGVFPHWLRRSSPEY